MLKILLCISFTTISTIVGAKISKGYKRRERFFFDAVNFCNSFNANLDFFRKSLIEFVTEFCQNAGEDFCKLISCELSGENTILLFVPYFRKQLLTEEHIQYFSAFLKVLGRSDATAQKSQILTYKSYFERQLLVAKENFLKKGKMCGKLGVLAGLFVSVMII